MNKPTIDPTRNKQKTSRQKAFPQFRWKIAFRKTDAGFALGDVPPQLFLIAGWIGLGQLTGRLSYRKWGLWGCESLAQSDGGKHVATSATKDCLSYETGVNGN